MSDRQPGASIQHQMPVVDFGETGLCVSRLSIGTGTHGWGGRSEQTKLGLHGLADLLRKAYSCGITFWDAADGYGSHAHIAQALRGTPRQDIVITTKTTARSSRAAQSDVERFLTELGTDVLDIVLLHYLRGGDWPQQYRGAMDALARAKEQGKVRALGISCHSLEALRTACDSDWVQVVLARINYAGVNMDGTPDRVVDVLDQLYRAGKAVYGMKVLGCGDLAEDPRSAIQYVLGLGTVHAITIGMTTPGQVEQNAQLTAELARRCPLQLRGGA
jgi:aryl-alcohol dehydrogenase-like predicted oxidoreductase